MIKAGTILTVVEYNRLMTEKFEADSKAHWEKHNGNGQIKDYKQFAIAEGQAPFYGMYVFTYRGELRKTGYVLKTERGAQLFKLKYDAKVEKRKLRL